MRHRYLRPSWDLPEIYLYRQPVDFRKQANGLALIVEQELGHSQPVLRRALCVHQSTAEQDQVPDVGRQRLCDAVTLEQLEALLPWNAELPASKKAAQYG